GSGKTHAYWAYKNMERKMLISETEKAEEEEEMPSNLPSNWTIIYVPSPPAASRILLHVYTCLLDELSSSVIKVVAEKLVEQWGGLKKKKLGLFGGQDLEVTIQNGIREYPGIFSDCVKCLCIYVMDKDRSALAERWLLGETMDLDELTTLGITSVIESDDICLAMIKLICENAGKTVVLYFDEIESPYRMHGPEAESKFLEVLKRLYNEIKNVVIVIAVLKEIWPRILETADQAMKSRMEQERELEYFKFDDLLLYFAKSMEYFWAQNNLNPPIYPLFPLNEEILKAIFSKTDGNQRSIIKLIRIFVDKLVYDEMPLEEVIKESLPVGTTVASESAIIKPKAPAVHDVSILDKIEEMMSDEDYTIEANPASVAGAALKSIKVLGEKYNKEIKINLDFKFLVGKRSYSLAGMIEYNGNKYGLEVPSVKTFDKSGGVAAYYATKRLADAIATKQINYGILIVPEGTGGNKFKSLLEQNEGALYKFEFHDDSAKFLIQQAIKMPSKEGLMMAQVLFGELPDYIPPVPPSEAPQESEENPEADTEENSDNSE
ncbi:MAG: hypothetical protein ACTSXK_05300, partial [Promethearchaeota archaeon]